MGIILIVIFVFLYYKLEYRFSYSLSLILKYGLYIIGFIIMFQYIILPIYYIVGEVAIVVIMILLISIGVSFYIMNSIKRKQEIMEFNNMVISDINTLEYISYIHNNVSSEFIEYDKDNIPYNRVVYFSANENVNIESENIIPMYYHARGADNSMAFQEYGFLVTSEGIIIKTYDKTSKRSDNNPIKSIHIPFNNIYKVKMCKNGKKLFVYYIDKTIKVVNCLNEQEIEFIHSIIYISINVGWTKLVESKIEEDVQYNLMLEDIDTNLIKFESNTTEEERRIIFRNILEDYNNELDEAANFAEKNIINDKDNKILADVVSVGNSPEILSVLNDSQLNSRFSGARGHGHVGEQAGNTLDRLQLKKVKALGASNEKWGADRLVNGENIQTKYCSTATKSIGEFFDKVKVGGYINSNGKMMTVEVPKDQYSKSLELMKQRILNGDVPNEANPNNASKYIKKGALTYKQSQIATKSIFDRNSTIKINGSEVKVTFKQKLMYSAGVDFMTGVSIALPGSIITGVWVFCNNLWQGKNKQEAIKNSLVCMSKPVLLSGTVFMVSSQFSRSSIGTNLAQKLGTTKDAVMKGSMLGLMIAITVGPDVIDTLRGRMSFNQLLKNTATTGGGIATGAAIGTVMGGPIGTAVGSVIGGTVGSFVVKRTLDNFIEDDAKTMIRIAKEEFIDEVMLSGLSKEEFNQVLSNTFLHKNFGTYIKKMYASGDSRKFAKETFYNEVLRCYSERELPEVDDIIYNIVANRALGV